ncbi:elongation factor P maturation arginine rhamnosyltransferase EarP [Ideonella azotifigens]|uniref:Protein-arginine rhamnosyltransferase n=2 Tax=Ideonella azotifigens TaxID=513160 RepID=A0ABN1JXF8_9BURK
MRRMPRWDWDLLCRVIDNHGDLGVCWRLARDLVARGHHVRLWLDDERALRWMAPDGPPPGLQVLPWPTGEHLPALFDGSPGDVVVEAFGCDPPPALKDRIAQAAAAGRAPVWINLEYLSAEAYVERSHRLRSPQRLADDLWLDKWFFYPGFTAATGGLLREPGLDAEQARFDAATWLAAHGIAPRPDERLVSLFCYENPQLQPLLTRLAEQPTLLLTAPGPATEGCDGLVLPANLRWQPLPWLSQPEYDRLLWAGDLNLVRGEDSFVRAQWAGRPFLWQIYPQDDGVHAGKLAAFLDQHLAAAPEALATQVRQAMWAWNGLAPAGPFPALPTLPDWQAGVLHWRAHLFGQPPLVEQLLDFVAGKR